MATKLMNVTTPQILWHGGGVTDGKADPVYSLDFHPKENVLLTTGIDASIPPRGSVRLWKIDADREEERFLVDFSEHGSVVNVARFSPCGTMIASASDKQVIIYRVVEPLTWAEVEDLKQVERKRFTPSLNDIVDLQWSPDSSYIIIGALEQKPEIIRIAAKEKQRENSLLLPSHGNYVQGVTWDPYNQVVATQSADRSVKVHKLSYRENTMVRLAPNGHVTIKMYANPSDKEKEEGATSDWQIVSEAEGGGGSSGNEVGGAGSAKKAVKRGVVGVNLFADSNVPSSFRRLSFTPDGSFLVVPTGVHRPLPNPTTSTAATSSSSSSTGNNNNNSKASGSNSSNQNTSFCTHLFARNNYQQPAISLLGLEDPSVAVRCCPRLFKHIQKPSSAPPSSSANSNSETNASSNPSDSAVTSLVKGDYRMVFAVVTITAVYIYDTQHCYPLAKLRGLHYAPINDAAWSADGRILAVCSSDGYLSFVRFKAGALGDMLEEEQVPDIVKLARPGAYDMSQLKVKPQPVPATAVEQPIDSTTTNNSTPAPNTEEVQAVATSQGNNTAAEATSNEEKKMEIDNATSLPLIDNTNTTSISNNTTSNSNSSASAAGANKKRKRIQPEKIELTPETVTQVKAEEAAGVGGNDLTEDKQSPKKAKMTLPLPTCTSSPLLTSDQNISNAENLAPCSTSEAQVQMQAEL